MKPEIYAFADEAGKNIADQIAAMKRNSLCGLEIRGVDGENVSDISPDKAREVRKKLDDAGLVTWSIGSPIGKINIGDDFESHLDKLKRTLETGNILGAGNIRLFSFYMPEGENPDLYEGEVTHKMNIMAEICHRSGTVPCHENEKGIFGDSPDRCLKLLENVEGLEGVFDPANYIQCGYETYGAWTKLKKHIRYLHIKDALADGSVVPAGRGIGNVAKIAEEYFKAGGKAVTLEPHLTVFDGLGGLEKDGGRSLVGQYFYPDSGSAFDAAAAAFRELIKDFDK